MDLKEFVNMIDPMTCIISVESDNKQTYGDIRIVKGCR